MLTIHHRTAEVIGRHLIIQATTASKHNRYRLENQYQYEIEHEQFFYHCA
jgi:hypothetical protein